MSADEKIETACGCCGSVFTQPNDPGRKRVYCSDACKQRVYRARRGVTGHEARNRRTAEAKAEQERREREARRRRDEDAARARARRERDRRRAQQAGPSWTRPQAGDNPTIARARVRGAKLMERAMHAGTGANEATACREKAEAIRNRYGL